MAADKKNRINADITSPEVRLIVEDGTNAGVVSIDVAQQQARDSQLDLVEIVPNAEPPVCRVMDFGKHLFDLNKKKQAAKRKQKQVQVKEIKFRPGTDSGDYQIKVRNLKRFLDNGDKVKVTLRFRGREMAHQELGVQMLQRVETDLSELGSVEQFPKMEGRQMVMVIAPKRA
ncbi:MAG: translation initiation factor IF-3 [Alphaproteobacteria bacterium]|nr:MAG: translation initiation factor IF-3 [Alphaproteobacteria bacterium]